MASRESIRSWQLLIQDLSGGTGQAPYAGLLETLQIFFDAALGPDRPVKNLFRREAVNVDVR